MREMTKAAEGGQVWSVPTLIKHQTQCLQPPAFSGMSYPVHPMIPYTSRIRTAQVSSSRHPVHEYPGRSTRVRLRRSTRSTRARSCLSSLLGGHGAPASKVCRLTSDPECPCPHRTQCLQPPAFSGTILIPTTDEAPSRVTTPSGHLRGKLAFILSLGYRSQRPRRSCECFVSAFLILDAMFLVISILDKRDPRRAIF